MRCMVCLCVVGWRKGKSDGRISFVRLSGVGRGPACWPAPNTTRKQQKKAWSHCDMSFPPHKPRGCFFACASLSSTSLACHRKDTKQPKCGGACFGVGVRAKAECDGPRLFCGKNGSRTDSSHKKAFARKLNTPGSVWW